MAFPVPKLQTTRLHAGSRSKSCGIRRIRAYSWVEYRGLNTWALWATKAGRLGRPRPDTSKLQNARPKTLIEVPVRVLLGL